jgi:ribosomal protein S13
MPQKAEEIVSKIKVELRKKHPKWTEEKINSVAYAITTKHYTDQGKEAPFNR